MVVGEVRKKFGNKNKGFCVPSFQSDNKELSAIQQNKNFVELFPPISLFVVTLFIYTILIFRAFVGGTTAQINSQGKKQDEIWR